MENINRENDIVLLLDHYSREAQQLYETFQARGEKVTAVCVEENGFLPEGIQSAYSYFMGDYGQSSNGQPLYFDRLTVPAFWEIKGTNQMGQVYDKSQERAKLFFAKPEHKRCIRVVDWMDEHQEVRSSDHYNRFGVLFARTTFNAKSQKFLKTYFDAKGREIITENFVTGNIILNWKDKVFIFNNKTKFIIFFLKEAGLDHSRIYYNSLAVPFFVSQNLSGRQKEDLLFWQEPRREDIPGNMQMIFSGDSNTSQVIVQKREAYLGLLEAGAPSQKLSCRGFVYPFVKENTLTQEALICTNSDNIAQLKTLVEQLPDMKFHIAAYTEMSAKLMAFGTYDNVELYPNVKQKQLTELFVKCDYYFDINYGGEIGDSVYRAFLHNHWIVAFSDTVHTRDYVAQEHIYLQANVQEMIRDIKAALQKPSVLENHLKLQKMSALSENLA